jgi:mannose-6-phosphate isomerase-like protein (cupin superfamily)
MQVETRPWGRFVVLYSDKSIWLKRLIISPGQSLSLQTHKDRDEYWVTEDEGVVAYISFKLGSEEIQLEPGEVYCAPADWYHRIRNSSDKEVHVIEWATGSPKESDITRYQDIYGRS